MARASQQPIRPNPDYYTTLLFRRLFGNTVLATTADAGSLLVDST